jgi:hypothetical protein
VQVRELGDVPAPSFHYFRPYDIQICYMRRKDNVRRQMARRVEEEEKHTTEADRLGLDVVAPLYTSTVVYVHWCERMRRGGAKQTR